MLGWLATKDVILTNEPEKYLRGEKKSAYLCKKNQQESDLSRNIRLIWTLGVFFCLKKSDDPFLCRQMNLEHVLGKPRKFLNELLASIWGRQWWRRPETDFFPIWERVGIRSHVFLVVFAPDRHTWSLNEEICAIKSNFFRSFRDFSTADRHRLLQFKGPLENKNRVRSWEEEITLRVIEILAAKPFFSLSPAVEIAFFRIESSFLFFSTFLKNVHYLSPSSTDLGNLSIKLDWIWTSLQC